jgi:quercetin dioxygenase-like cupin family protein
MEMNEAQFRQQLKEQGYSEAQSLEYGPNSVNDMHSHDFSAFALVLSGEFTLVTEDGSVTHQPGEACKLAAGTLHSEQAGAGGATLLIGKK